MEPYDQIIPLLPEFYAGQLRREDFDKLEEIRMGVGRPLRLRYAVGEREFFPLARQDQVEEVLQRACHRSVYAFSDTIAEGYLTLSGGHRIGLCGTGVRYDGKIQSMQSISSMNIRIAREISGCADALAPEILDSVLLLGPPGSGKTTLLRDLIRQLSDRYGHYIGLADERCELSAQSLLRIGTRTDVLLQIPKATAMLMLLRTMRPDWIAVDEITSPEDIMAMEIISYCGVKLIATAHGIDRRDLIRRPLYRKLLDSGIFRQLVILHPDKSYTLEEMT